MVCLLAGEPVNCQEPTGSNALSAYFSVHLVDLGDGGGVEYWEEDQRVAKEECHFLEDVRDESPNLGMLAGEEFLEIFVRVFESQFNWHHHNVLKLLDHDGCSFNVSVKVELGTKGFVHPNPTVRSPHNTNPRNHLGKIVIQQIRDSQISQRSSAGNEQFLAVFPGAVDDERVSRFLLNEIPIFLSECTLILLLLVIDTVRSEVVIGRFVVHDVLPGPRVDFDLLFGLPD